MSQGCASYGLLTDHIPFSDMRRVPAAEAVAAARYQLPPPGIAAVSFQFSSAALQEAVHKARYWLVPLAARPLPLGSSRPPAAEIARLLKAAPGSHVAATTWLEAHGDEGMDCGIQVRYHYVFCATPDGVSNVNTMLLSSTIFDLNVIAEFRFAM